MPRLKPAEYTKKDALLVGKVREWMYYYNYSLEYLATKLGVTPQTLRYKMKAPSRFTLAELRDLCDALRIPSAERGGMI